VADTTISGRSSEMLTSAFLATWLAILLTPGFLVINEGRSILAGS
jgi:hypothetical protein